MVQNSNCTYGLIVKRLPPTFDLLDSWFSSLRQPMFSRSYVSLQKKFIKFMDILAYICVYICICVCPFFHLTIHIGNKYFKTSHLGDNSISLYNNTKSLFILLYGFTEISIVPIYHSFSNTPPTFAIKISP